MSNISKLEHLRAQLAEARGEHASCMRIQITAQRKTIAAEKATNPFLRAGEPSLAQGVDLAPGTQPSVVFAALRAWKNRF